MIVSIFFSLQLGFVLKLADIDHSSFPPLSAQLGLQCHFTMVPLD